MKELNKQLKDAENFKTLYNTSKKKLQIAESELQKMSKKHLEIDITEVETLKETNQELENEMNLIL